ncbi:MAG: tryptophan halogenase family protein [Brevundimonas sp.]
MQSSVMSTEARIERVVIVGGGTAGWMTAAALTRRFRGAPLRITLVESSEIGTIGVGEATIPTIRRFYARLAMSDAEVMRAVQATCKLGIRFEGWSGHGSAFLHPFGLYGQDLDGIGFHHFWLADRARGSDAPLAAYSLGASMAEAGRFTLPSPNPPSSLSVFDWALHLDASLFAQHLRAFAEAGGCERLDGRIGEVRLDPSGAVRALGLADGREVEGELFIDCSGFRGLVIGEALGEPYEDWGRWLLCDSAFAVQSRAAPEMPPMPFTRVTARSAGWQWGIPLRHRAGNGLVFSSRHQSDEEALAELTPHLMGEPLTEPRRIGFRPGRRRRAWVGNCVAIGLSAGFLEPLESTSIALIETAIERLMSVFPDRAIDQALRDEFNDQTAEEMERVRDFILLHYLLNRRDEPFWRDARSVEPPETLVRKLGVWDARGEFVRYRWEMFHPASWLAIYDGMGRYPRALDPAVEGVDAGRLSTSLAALRGTVAKAVAATPHHAEFLKALDDQMAA